MKYKTFVKGHGINEEDFMWMWSYYQNRSFVNFVNSTSLANLSKIPNVILWNSHLTDEHFIHYLVSWVILNISKIYVDDTFKDPELYTIQLWTDSKDCNDLTIKRVAEAGFKMIFSNFDGCYLDCGYAGWVVDGNNWCSPYRGWQVIFKLDEISQLFFKDISF